MSPLLLLFDRDVFSFIRGILKVQGPGTTKVAKVKGRGGQVRAIDQVNDQHADHAAGLGRRMVPESVIDARRRYFAAASHRYPLVEDLHRCFIACSSRCGKVGGALDPPLGPNGQYPDGASMVGHDDLGSQLVQKGSGHALSRGFSLLGLFRQVFLKASDVDTLINLRRGQYWSAGRMSFLELVALCELLGWGEVGHGKKLRQLRLRLARSFLVPAAPVVVLAAAVVTCQFVTGYCSFVGWVLGGCLLAMGCCWLVVAW